jgi:hypothetical protein
MWMEKLECGVLRVMTPLGPRYIQLSFWERVCLMWMFRHFDTLPQIVLKGRQQELVDRLCREQKFVSMNGWGEAPILGTVERRPIMENFTLKGSSAEVRAAAPLVADSGQES